MAKLASLYIAWLKAIEFTDDIKWGFSVLKAQTSTNSLFKVILAFYIMLLKCLQASPPANSKAMPTCLGIC